MQNSQLDGPSGSGPGGRRQDAVVVPDNQGNLRITIKKSKPTLGIVIEGGSDTKHPMPRIIHIHVNILILLKFSSYYVRHVFFY